MSEPLVISTEGLSKRYGDVQALGALDLKVPRNSIFGFLGPNGSGKTTTIKLLLGLARPTGGAGKIFGLDIVRESVEIRRRVGYLAQDARFYEHMTARQTLRFAARFFYKGPRAQIEARVDEMLELAGLTQRADRPIKGFSGGERQRLGIAQAQVNHPDLLILDEPAASLDPVGRRDVLEMMARLRERTTLFYSTHILEDVERVSDTVAILDRGQLVSQAPIKELLQRRGTPEFILLVKGELAKAQARLTSQPWVTAIQATPGEGHTSWRVATSDEAAAEAQLLPLVLAGGEVTVLELRRKETGLEETFMRLTGNLDGKR